MLGSFKCAPSVAVLAVAWILAVARAYAGDWLTFGHDPQRSGCAEDETELNPKTVSALKLRLSEESSRP
jgi:hypothetical protein